MTAKDLIVGKSKIHGRGVFAARAFRKGEVVLEWDLTHKVKKADIPALPPSIRKNVYFFKGRYIVPTSPGRYLNHSCNPNTVAVEGRDIALRNISKGEEITIDFFAESILGMDFECSCGAPNCKGKVAKQRVRKDAPRDASTQKRRRSGTAREIPKRKKRP